jgi:hypothetical protein
MISKNQTKQFFENSREAYNSLSDENKSALEPHLLSGDEFAIAALKNFVTLHSYALNKLLGKKSTIFSLLDILSDYTFVEPFFSLIEHKPAKAALMILLKNLINRVWVTEEDQNNNEFLSTFSLIIELALEANNIEPSRENIKKELDRFFYKAIIGSNATNEIKEFNTDSKLLKIFSGVKVGDFEDRLPKNGVRYNNLKKEHDFQKIELYLIQEKFIDPVNFAWLEEKAQLKALCEGLYQSEFFERSVNGTKIKTSKIERYLEARYLTDIRGIKKENAKYHWYNKHFSLYPFFLKKIGPTK